MRKHLLLFVAVLSFIVEDSFSQSDNPFVNKVDSITSNLNKNYITTGILYDRVPSLAALDLFNPQIDTSNHALFTQAYFELYYGCYNVSGWQSPGQEDSMIWDNNVSGFVPIGILDYQFNMMDSFAVQDNLFTYQNGLLYDVPGRSRSPYFLKRIQLSAPLANSINTGTIKLKYLPEFFKSNLNLTISSITIYGLTASAINLPINGTIVYASITDPGIKTMQIQVVYSNGEQFTRTCTLKVQGTSIFARTTEEGPPPNDDYWWSSTIPFQGYSNEPTAYCGKNRISIYSRGTDNTLKQIMKPIIIIDGFDPKNLRKASTIYKDAFAYINGNQPANFADELRVSGFDLIIVDQPSYNNTIITRNDQNNLLPYPPGTINGGGDYIQRNAMVLVSLIQDINNQLQANGSIEQIIIVGPSMGGQISRWALRYMEVNGMNHNCKLWVSFDSPHQGALLPIGIQRLAAGFSFSDAAKTALEVQINCPAAKQMLVHHHLSDQELPTGAPGFKDRYYQELDNLGWPTQCRKIAMLSGADNGTMVQPGSPGQKAIDVEVKLRYPSRHLLLGLLGLVVNPVLIKGNVYLAPNQTQNRGLVFDGRVLFRNLTDRYSIAPQYCQQSIDLVQSGFYPGFSEIKEASDKKWTGSFLNRIASQNFNALLSIHAHEFLYSTLALGKGPNPNPNRKWDDNISNINVTCESEKESPFDAYWGPDINTKHDSLLYGHVIRLRDEFNGTHMDDKKAITQTISNSSIGPWCAGIRRTFQILNPKAGQTFTWGTSNSFLVIRNGQGTSSIEVEYTGGAIGGVVYIRCLSVPTTCYTFNIPDFVVQVNFGLPSIYGNYFTNGQEQPLHIWFGNPSTDYNNACNLQTTYTNMQVSGASSITWSKVSSSPSNIGWSQNGNNLNFYFWNIGQTAVFKAEAGNGCGTFSYNFGFKSINCSSGGGGGCYQYMVSPNPASNSIKVIVPNIPPPCDLSASSGSENSKSLQRTITEIKIYDNSGNLKKIQKENKTKQAKVNLNGLTTGVYIIEIKDGTFIERQKIIIRE